MLILSDVLINFISSYQILFLLMENSLECQAILNLLHLCDQDSPLSLKNNYITPEPNNQRVLTEHARAVKSNTATPYHHSYNCTIKVKTEGQASAERTKETTQNKENLKRILQKLRNSPSPQKKQHRKERKMETFHIKTLNSQPQSRSKQFKKTPDPITKSLKKMVRRIKQKDLIKSLVKAKIVEKLKTAHLKNGELGATQRLRQESSKISTLRNTQALRRGQMALQNDKNLCKKQSISYYNMLRDERVVNMGVLLSGINSQVNLKHLLF